MGTYEDNCYLRRHFDFDFGCGREGDCYVGFLSSDGWDDMHRKVDGM